MSNLQRIKTRFNMLMEEEISDDMSYPDFIYICDTYIQEKYEFKISSLALPCYLILRLELIKSEIK